MNLVSGQSVVQPLLVVFGQPVVASVAPSSASVLGGEWLEIQCRECGRHAADIVAVWVGPYRCTNVSVTASQELDGEQTIRCMAPSGSGRGLSVRV